MGWDKRVLSDSFLDMVEGELGEQLRILEIPRRKRISFVLIFSSARLRAGSSIHRCW